MREYTEAVLHRPNMLSLLRLNGMEPGGRRIYLNLGAANRTDADLNLAASTILPLVMNFPDANNFEQYAFEGNGAYNKYWRVAEQQEPKLHFTNAIVWNEDTTLDFGLRHSASHVVLDGKDDSIFGRDKKISSTHRVNAVNFSRWLREHVEPDDFVLAKMDIEGSEFQVLPSLIESRAACLLDEIFVECHHEAQGDIGKQRSFADCVTMVEALRGLGVAAHLWF